MNYSPKSNPHKISRWLSVCAVAALIMIAAGREARAVLANAFHIPDDNTEVLNPSQSGINMRSPEFEIGPSTTVTVYSGVQKFNNSYGTANQTGGTLFYKGVTQPTWSSNGLAFANNNGNNQYWSASFNTSSFGTNEVIQYFLYLTFDGVNGVSNTFIYGGDAASQVTGTQSVAAASPLTGREQSS